MEKWEGRTDFANHNPSTTVHELVRSLNHHLVGILHNLLEQRFGELPEKIKSQLEQADFKQLQYWSLQLPNSADLKDIFETSR